MRTSQRASGSMLDATTLDSAEAAARRSGQSLDAWLAEAVAERAGTPSPRRPAARSAAANAEVEAQLADIARTLDRLSRTETAVPLRAAERAARPRTGADPLDPPTRGRVEDAVRRLDHRLDALLDDGRNALRADIEARLADIDRTIDRLAASTIRVAEPAPRALPPEAAPPAASAGAGRNWSANDIEGLVAEIAARQAALDEPRERARPAAAAAMPAPMPAAAPAQAPNPAPAPPPLAPPVDDRLRRELDRLGATLADLSARPAIDLTPLERRLDGLMADLRRLDGGGRTAAGLAELSDRIAALGSRLDMLDDLEAQHSITGQRLDGVMHRLGDVAGALGSMARPDPQIPRALEAIRGDLSTIGARLADTAPRRAFEELARGIADLGRRIDESRAAGVDRTLVEGIGRALADLERAVLKLEPNDPTPAIAAELRRLEARFDRLAERGPDTETLTRLSADVGDLRDRLDRGASDAAVRELSSRLDTLGRRFETKLQALAVPPPAPDFAPLVARLDDLRARFDAPGPEQALDAIARRLDDLAADRPAAPDLSPLVHRLDEMAALMASPARSNDLEAMARRLDGMAAELAARPATARPLEDLSRKLDQLAADLAPVRAAPAPAAAALGALEKRIGELASRFDDLAASRRTETAALDTIRDRLDRVGEAVDRLPPMLPADTPPAEAAEASILARLDRFGVDLRQALATPRPAPAPALPPELETTLVRLHDRLAELTDPADRPTGEFGRQIVDLAAKLDALAARNEDAPVLDGLERQIMALAEKLDGAEENLTRLGGIERGLGDLFAHLEEVRSTVLDSGERTARAVLAGVPAQPALYGDLNRDVADLKASRETADRRTQDTLTALHGALERVVERLSGIEQDLRRAPAEPVRVEPARAEAPRPREVRLAAPRADDADQRRTQIPQQQPPVAAAPAPAPARPAPAAMAPPAASVPAIEPEPAPVVAPQSPALARLEAAMQGFSAGRPANAPPPLATSIPAPPATRPLAAEPVAAPQAPAPVMPAPVAAARPPAAPAVEPPKPDARLFDDTPIEPGAGGPRMPMAASAPAPAAAPPRPSAAERVAASREALGPIAAGRPLDAETKATFIAAARRAAQAAAAEAAPVVADKAKPAGKPGLSLPKLSAPKLSAPNLGGLGSGLKKHRKLIIMLAGALVLAAGTLQLVSFLKRTPRPAAEPAAVTRTLPQTQRETPAAPEAATPAAPAAPATPGPRAAAPSDPLTVAAPASGVVGAPGTVVAAAPGSAPGAAPATTGAQPSPQARAAAPAAAPATTGAIPRTPAGTLPQLDNPATGPVGRGVAGGLPATIGPATLRNAALAGDPAAAHEIGIRFAEGRGVGQNFEEAARWLERAAKEGVAAAQYRLGALHEKGQGVPRNPQEARRWYQAAADQGHAKAMHNLAVLFAEGIEGQPDYRTAVQWFRRAADHGVVDSQYNLGILYARGLGVDQNLVESYKWFSLAANGGDADAAKKREDVGARLNPQSLAAARLAVDSFAPQAEPANVAVAAPPGGWDAIAGPAAPAGTADERAQTRRAQELLGRLGLLQGGADGQPGRRTQDAVRAFERREGLPATGRVTPELLRRLERAAG